MAKANPVTTEQGQAQSGIQSRALSRGQQGSRWGLARREELMPALWAESPFALVGRFSEDMDRFFSDVLGDFGMQRSWWEPDIGRGLGLLPAAWSPPIDVIERDGELVVSMDVPGISVEDIDVEVTEDTLIITCERREEREQLAEGYRPSRRRFGRFSRRIPLPEGVDAEDVQASLENGVLEVAMPAPEREQRGRRIEIQEGASGGAQPSGEQPKTAP